VVSNESLGRGGGSGLRGGRGRRVACCGRWCGGRVAGRPVPARLSTAGQS